MRRENSPRDCDPVGSMYISHSVAYKLGRHGYTYRHNGEEWVRSACRLERIFGGDFVLHSDMDKRKPKIKPSAFAIPTSHLAAWR